jgi:hypothetical protein
MRSVAVVAAVMGRGGGERRRVEVDVRCKL